MHCKIISIFLILTITLPAGVFSFHGAANHCRAPVPSALSISVKDYNDSQSVNSFGRRSLSAQLTVIPMIAALAPFLPEPATASGGATAGGAYLLSAKQRYNERVKASVQGLLSVAEGLKSGDTKSAKAFFESEEGGSWKDLTTAGYLLSNAFRRNSTAAPDSLPSVKKYKAFAAEIANFQKALKKKGAAASDEFPKVEAALNDWLIEIDLPVAREL
ncbi:hypothetical protein IV203_001694 [Nitzschia inconspicua]|uniref:Uncharacterized protein n=1 Tax=Nitzschia inconspicua TaxID=303405 RepID=A0A9K3L916_9STRA|nr:hypothetical protein IV203_001694 [Nitzschia inconspicua]